MSTDIMQQKVFLYIIQLEIEFFTYSSEAGQSSSGSSGVLPLLGHPSRQTTSLLKQLHMNIHCPHTIFSCFIQTKFFWKFICFNVCSVLRNIFPPILNYIINCTYLLQKYAWSILAQKGNHTTRIHERTIQLCSLT